MEFLRLLVYTLRNLKTETVAALAAACGNWLYVVLFAIIFAETGLVVIPFLPGDSLLFTVGAVAAQPDSQINFYLVGALLIIAAVLGDAVNYAIGFYLGPAVFKRENSWLLNKKHLNEAHEFYERYGGKTIILARFVPIIRTFAPFVAGIGRMNYFRFAVYNVTGGVAWVVLCLLAGRLFGQLEVVKNHFDLVVVAIVVISVLPAVIEVARNRWGRRTKEQVAGTAPDPSVGEAVHLPAGAGEERV